MSNNYYGKVGDKRTKECRRCFNTSPWVCFKCRQQRNKESNKNG